MFVKKVKLDLCLWFCCSGYFDEFVVLLSSMLYLALYAVHYYSLFLSMVLLFFLIMNSMHYRMIVNEWYLPAFATLAVSGASDWVRIAPLETAKSITILLISSVVLLSEHSWMAF